MLHVSGLRKVFSRRVAVDGLSFDASQGETMGLIGPNGAGKSTTMALLAGLLMPDAGEISIGSAGHSPTSAAGRRLVGLVPQELALYPDLTAEENLQFFGRLYGLSGHRLRARIADVLSLFGLLDRGGDRVGTFSGGMQRRLNLACALLHEPEIVLLDEPTVGIDPHSRRHVLDAIAALRRQGLTVVYSTHYMEEVEELCDRVAIVDHGRLLALDTVWSLVDRYGGATVVEAEVDARDPRAATIAEEPSRACIDGASPEVNGSKLRWTTDDPLVALSRITALGLPVKRLQLRRPGLEDVFLALTGRALRDE